MEEELGYPLFERRKGVKSALPTSRGLAFSHIASQMLALWNEADQIGGMSDSPFLTIATVDSFLDYNLTRFTGSSYPCTVFPWISNAIPRT